MLYLTSSSVSELGIRCKTFLSIRLKVCLMKFSLLFSRCTHSFIYLKSNVFVFLRLRLRLEDCFLCLSLLRRS